VPITNSNILFIHIPKCGGTSLEVALGIAADYPELGLKRTSTRPDFRRLFGGGLQHLSVREVISTYPYALGPQDLFSFSVVRDCVDRFVSHFVWKNYRFTPIRPIDSEMMNLFFAQVDQLVAFAKTIDLFNDPYDGQIYLEGDDSSVHPSDQLRHLLPQCSYLYNRGVLAVDKIFPIEEMDQVEKMLSHMGALSGPIPYRMVGPTSKKLRQAIPAQVERLIRSIYRHDQTLVTAVRERGHPELSPRRDVVEL
jgi:hypothetical protein